MGKVLTREEAWELLNEYNKEPFHLRHGETVEGVMRYLAQELGYGDEVDFWGNVGLLHDLDFEQWPEEHCAKVQELLGVLKGMAELELLAIYFEQDATHEVFSFVDGAQWLTAETEV